jgi:hypothetical protein
MATYAPGKVRDTDDPIVVVNSCPPESCTTQLPLKIIRGSWVVMVTFWVKTEMGRAKIRRTSSNMMDGMERKIFASYLKIVPEIAGPQTTTNKLLTLLDGIIDRNLKARKP